MLVAEDVDLTTPSGLESTLRSAVFVAGYAAVLAAAERVGHPLVWGAAWVAMGALMLGCWAAMHEAIHSHLYRTKRANKTAGVLWGAVLLANFSAYRAYHLQHHAHTREPGDPEGHDEFKGAGQYLFYAPMIGALFWLQLAWASAASLRNRHPAYARTRRQRNELRANAALTTALTGAAVVAAAQWPLAVARWWAVPLALSTLAMSVVTLAEHYGCEDTADSLRSTRTTLSNPVMRFLFWNNNFHAAHHTWPAVPYNRVPALDRRLRGQKAYTARSYTSFHLGLLRELLDKSRQARAS